MDNEHVLKALTKEFRLNQKALLISKGEEFRIKTEELQQLANSINCIVLSIENIHTNL